MTLFSLYIVAVAFFNYLLVPGVAISRPPWILGLLLVGRALFQSLREGYLPRPGPFGLALMFFGVTTIANGVLVLVTDAARVADYLRTEFQFLLVLGIVFAFVRARLDEHGVARLLKVWVWTAGAAAAFGIYQSFARVLGLPLPELPVVIKGSTGIVAKEFFGFFAASSWFREPSWLGSFLLVPLLYVLGVILLDAPHPFRFPKRWGAALAALLALALFLSLSQAAYVSMLVVAVPLVWSLRDRLRVGRVLRIAGAAAVLMAAIMIPLSRRGADIVQAQWSRFTAIANAWGRPHEVWGITSYGIRMADMRGGITMWQSSPVLGVGINTVRYHRQAALLSDPESGSVDSGLLQVLVEQGVVGFGAFVLALLVLWERLARAYTRERDAGRLFLLWFLMWGLVTDVVNSVVTHPWQHPQRWLVIGLAASFLAFLERERDEQLSTAASGTPRT